MNILDRRFKYTSAAATDIRKTFARVRRQLADQKQTAEQKVTPIKKRAAK